MEGVTSFCRDVNAFVRVKGDRSEASVVQYLDAKMKEEKEGQSR